MNLKEKIEELTRQRALFIGLSLMEQEDHQKKTNYWAKNEELEQQIIKLKKNLK